MVSLAAKLALFSVSKKVAVLLLAKVYGIPRLYRHTLRGSRLVWREPAARQLWVRRIETAFRLPDRVLAALRSLVPRSAPAATGAALVPSRLAAAARLQLQQAPRTAAGAGGSRLRHLAGRVGRHLRAASQRVRSSAPAPAPPLATGVLLSPHPWGSFAAQPLLAGRAAALRVGVAAAKGSLLRSMAEVKQSVAAKGRSALEQAALRAQAARRERYWQRSLVGFAAQQ